MRIFLVKAGRIPSEASLDLSGQAPRLLPESINELNYLATALKIHHRCTPLQIASGPNHTHCFTSLYLQSQLGGTVVSCRELDLMDSIASIEPEGGRAKSLSKNQRTEVAKQRRRQATKRNIAQVTAWFAVMPADGDQIVVVGTKLLEVIGGIALPTFPSTPCLIGDLDWGQTYLLTSKSPAGVLIDPLRGLNSNTGLVRNQARTPVAKN